MAEVNQNIFLRGLKGRLGEFVLRQYKGKTIVCRYPVMPESRSRKQKANSQRFREAVAFAREVMADPERKAAYQKEVKRKQSVFHYVVGVYLRGEGRLKF
jgi:hypothetical protein